MVNFYRIVAQSSIFLLITTKQRDGHKDSAVLIMCSRETSLHCHPQLKQIRGGHFEITYIFIFCIGKKITQQ